MNSQIIQQQIQNKIHSDNAYYCPSEIFREIQTDINEFPYRRYFRGEIDASNPIVWDREPGYQRILTSPQFNARPTETSSLTDLCFQIPCSTILPCNANKYKSSLQNNRMCVYISP
jgi:hypothetical protein